MPLLESFPAEQLVAINVDITAVVARLLMHVDAVNSLAPVAAEKLRQFEPAQFARMETLAMALLQAHTLYMTAAVTVVDDLASLQETGSVLRARLFEDTSYRVKRGILDGQRLELVKCQNGYRNLATDLMALSHLLGGAWSVAASKCAVTLDDLDKATFRRRTEVRVLTPGSSGGERLHMLSSLERRSPRWDSDPDAARASLSAALSLVLRLVGRDPDPARSRDHVLLSVLAERRLLAGGNADLSALLHDLAALPITEVGALSVDQFIPKTERRVLAAALNTLLASPTFASWRQGASLDVAAWLTPRDDKTPAVIVSVAHLDDEERMLVLGVIFEEVLAWVRSLPGSQRLRALVVFDEVYGFLPPAPHNPPTKRPLVALMKQARAFGVGVVIATQNPMDLDYRTLGNAGLWCIGRLQTDADRERVVEGMASSIAGNAHAARDLSATIARLSARWFVVRDAHAETGPFLLQPRWALSWLRGPMTRGELAMARAQRAAEAEAASCASRTVGLPAGQTLTVGTAAIV